jgi:hypothetical protein
MRRGPAGRLQGARPRTTARACIAITKDVYGHLLEGDKRAAAESMSRVLFSGC